VKLEQKKKLKRGRPQAQEQDYSVVVSIAEDNPLLPFERATLRGLLLSPVSESIVKSEVQRDAS
jgi:hypothetical protein